MHSWVNGVLRLAIGSFCLAVSNGAAHASLAADWIASQAQPESGAIYSLGDIGTPLQSTTEAILSLTALEALGSPQAAAEKYVFAQAAADAETLARKILVAAGSGRDTIPLVEKLLVFQNADGGFGDEPAFGSSVMNTALAVAALGAAGISVSDSLGQAIGYLTANQQNDGGWAHGSSNASSTYLTALVCGSLQRYRHRYNLSAEIASATEFLIQGQSAMGGWGSEAESALALLALVPATPDSTRYQPGLAWLESRQLANGSWSNDVFTTALASRALQKAESAPNVAPPTTAVLSGQIIDDDAGIPVVGGLVSIAGSDSVTVQTGPDGRFLAEGLVPESYTLVYTANGFVDASQTVQVEPGQHLDVGAIHLAKRPDTAVVSGKILNAETGQPITATVRVTGAMLMETSAALDGSYSIAIPPGTVTLSILAPGYREVTATAEAQAGASLYFNPVLYPETADALKPDPSTTLTGTVVDAHTYEPMAGVQLQVTGGEVTATTDLQGKFSINGLPAGDGELVISRPDYQSVTLAYVSTPGSSVNFGALYLIPSVTLRTAVTGTVTNRDTGTPVVGAVVQAGGISARADGQGKYRIEGVSSLQFDVAVVAPGYLTETTAVTLQQHSNVQIDLSLQKVALNGISLTALGADKSEYDAYEVVPLSADVTNVGDESRRVVLMATVMTQSGQVLENFIVSGSELSRDSAFTVQPGQTLSRQFSWYTGIIPPGEYRFLVQALADETGAVLSEESFLLSVKQTQRLASIDVSADPAYLVEGQSANVKISARLRNGSNIDSSLNLDVVLLSPSGATIHHAVKELTVPFKDTVSTVDITQLTHTFSEPGTYQIEIASPPSWVVDVIDPGIMTVAPSIRVEAQVEIEPKRLVPGRDADIVIKLNLVGSEGATHE